MTVQKKTRPNLLQPREVSAQMRNLARTVSRRRSPIPTLQRTGILMPKLIPKPRLKQNPVPKLLLMLKRKQHLTPKLLLKPRLKQNPVPKLLLMPKRKQHLTPKLLLKPEPKKHPKHRPGRKRKSPLPEKNICAPDPPRLLLQSRRTRIKMAFPRMCPKQRHPFPLLNLPLLLPQIHLACERCRLRSSLG